MSDWLAKANNLLHTFDINEGEIGGSHQENIFVIGAPRSGTTVLSQYIVSCFEVGYVDNLMASFWKAPCFGALLSNKLITTKSLSADSCFGATSNISDIHEFGGFWREYLNYKGMEQRVNVDIDWKRLTSVLDNISKIKNKPMLYKVFQLYWHLSQFHEMKPKTKWIWIDRNVSENALSLLKLRKKIKGNEEEWASAKPIFSDSFETSSKEKQVISQVVGINQWIKNELHNIPDAQWIKVNYDEFVHRPIKEGKRLAHFLDLGFDETRAKEFAKNLSYRKPIEDLQLQKDIESVHDFAKKWDVKRGKCIKL
ncbi:sulfotransferase [Thalassotalea sp. Y01]|uniref:sulfotransferase n=1 Tax=Thalassotalea sp. Y01 TaxID=2729613 RepID=UPI00145CF639|nr:sulfotransferase [Thalassotalea sp. Y01]